MYPSVLMHTRKGPRNYGTSCTMYKAHCLQGDQNLENIDQPSNDLAKLLEKLITTWRSPESQAPSRRPRRPWCLDQQQRPSRNSLWPRCLCRRRLLLHPLRRPHCFLLLRHRRRHRRRSTEQQPQQKCKKRSTSSNRFVVQLASLWQMGRRRRRHHHLLQQWLATSYFRTMKSTS